MKTWACDTYPSCHKPRRRRFGKYLFLEWEWQEETTTELAARRERERQEQIRQARIDRYQRRRLRVKMRRELIEMGFFAHTLLFIWLTLFAVLGDNPTIFSLWLVDIGVMTIVLREHRLLRRCWYRSFNPVFAPHNRQQRNKHS